MRFIVEPIDVGGDSAYRPAMDLGQEILGLPKFEERTALFIQELTLMGKDGRHPVGVVSVNGPGKPEKFL
jgi:hypothetical protein